MTDSSPICTLQEESFHWNLNFAISLTANLLNLNSSYYFIFLNLSMIAYITEIQKLIIFNSVNLNIQSQVTELTTV